MRRVRFSTGLAVTALATTDVVVGDLLAAADAKYRILSVEFTAAWTEIKASIDGALLFGVAHGDYTATEIEEALEATLSISQGNMIAREQANRLVRILGIIQGDVITPEADSVFNDGRSIKKRLNWEIPIGIATEMWVMNSSGTVYTTGSVLILQGTANVVFT